MYASDPLIFVDQDNNYKIRQQLDESIIMDQQKYDYFLKLLTCDFILVDPNVFTGVNDTITARLYNSNTKAYRMIGFVFDEGLYDLDELITIFNQQFLRGTDEYYAKIVWNKFTSKLTLKIYPDVLALDNFNQVNFILSTNQAFIQNKILGFSQLYGRNDTLTFDVNNQYIIANTVPVISSYDRLLLRTNIVKPTTYISDPNRKGYAIRTNALVAFSSVGTAYSLKNNYSFTDLLYKIDSTKIDDISFELVGEHNEVLNVASGQVTGFAVQAVIIVMPKIKS